MPSQQLHHRAWSENRAGVTKIKRVIESGSARDARRKAPRQKRGGGRAPNDLNLVQQFMARVAASSCPGPMKCIE
jgi:hypothetical protein